MEQNFNPGLALANRAFSGVGDAKSTSYPTPSLFFPLTSFCAVPTTERLEKANISEHIGDMFSFPGSSRTCVR